ncbi:MAG TPA: chemoreceptor glutamine deamidase CheD [Rhodocyclaceae bacterium]|nr:chemoreceptor glutamine deamidase CheD [Rhodocyclaceae bacterium]
MLAFSQTEHLARNRYFDRHLDAETIKVFPGEYCVADGDMVLVTALGSCVTTCIRDREKGIGGLNHFMVAEGGNPSVPSRYGIYAMRLLINHLLKLGARRHRLEAKVFGGCRFLTEPSSVTTGKRNAAFVLEYLADERIPVVSKDLLGTCPRKVYFFPGTGRVLVKKLARLHNDTLTRREREYAARLNEAALAGDAGLFAK